MRVRKDAKTAPIWKGMLAGPQEHHSDEYDPGTTADHQHHILETHQSRLDDATKEPEWKRKLMEALKQG